MPDFKRFVTRRAFPLISALMAELQQQIFFEFVAGQFALLRFDAFDFRVLHQLQIEFDQFHRDALDRIDAAQSLRPRIDILDATFERRRQGAFEASSIIEAGLAVTSLSIATIASDSPTRIE